MLSVLIMTYFDIGKIGKENMLSVLITTYFDIGKIGKENMLSVLITTYFDIGKIGEEDVRVVVAPHVDDSAEVGHGATVPGATVVAVPLLLQVRHVRAGNLHHSTAEQPRLRERRYLNYIGERWSRGRASDCQSRGRWFNPTYRFET